MCEPHLDMYGVLSFLDDSEKLHFSLHLWYKLYEIRHLKSHIVRMAGE